MKIMILNKDFILYYYISLLNKILKIIYDFYFPQKNKEEIDISSFEKMDWDLHSIRNLNVKTRNLLLLNNYPELFDFKNDSLIIRDTDYSISSVVNFPHFIKISDIENFDEISCDLYTYYEYEYKKIFCDKILLFW